MEKCRVFAAAAVFVLTMLLAGCGQSGEPASVDGTTIVVDKNGGVTYYLVGDFDKEYYSLSELEAMAEEEAAEFGGEDTAEGQAVTVIKVEPLQSDESRVTVAYEFDGSGSFTGFTGSELFFGTVNEAVSRGYSLNGILKSVKDGSSKTEQELEKDGEKLLLITDAKAVIYCPSRVTYLSDGADLRDDGSVDASQTEGNVYILLK